MPARLPLSDEERRERLRAQNRAAYERYYARNGRRDCSEAGFRHDVETHRPPPHVLAERDRVLAIERDPIAELLGDPVPGRRTIDQRPQGKPENRP